MEEEDARVVAKSRPGRFDSQAVLSVVEFKFHSATPEEYRSKLLKFGRDLLQRIRERATGQLLECGPKIRTRRQALGDLLRHPTSDPPTKVWPLSVTSGNWTFADRVLKNVRRNVGLPAQDNGPDLHQRSNLENVYEFLCVASVHLSKDQDQNQRVLRNTDVSEIQHMFFISQNGIHSLENGELFGLTNKINWSLIPWRL